MVGLDLFTHATRHPSGLRIKSAMTVWACLDGYFGFILLINCSLHFA